MTSCWLVSTDFSFDVSVSFFCLFSFTIPFFVICLSFLLGSIIGGNLCGASNFVLFLSPIILSIFLPMFSMYSSESSIFFSFFFFTTLFFFSSILFRFLILSFLISAERLGRNTGASFLFSLNFFSSILLLFSKKGRDSGTINFVSCFLYPSVGLVTFVLFSFLLIENMGRLSIAFSSTNVSDFSMVFTCGFILTMLVFLLSFLLSSINSLLFVFSFLSGTIFFSTYEFLFCSTTSKSVFVFFLSKATCV